MGDSSLRVAAIAERAFCKSNLIGSVVLGIDRLSAAAVILGNLALALEAWRGTSALDAASGVPAETNEKLYFYTHFLLPGNWRRCSGCGAAPIPSAATEIPSWQFTAWLAWRRRPSSPGVMYLAHHI